MKKMKQKKPKKSKEYFTHIHEQAILDYVSTSDNKKRNELYVKIIQPAFLEMIEKIVYKYKFNNLPNIQLLMTECEGYLVTILSKFKKEKGSKAFSYFSVITKNWFTFKAKKYSSQIKKETQCEEISKDIEVEYLSIENDYVEKRVYEEFIDKLMKEINSWENINLKPNEYKILQAIKILLSQPDAIEIFNKKAIFLYIREITNLNTKQVLSNLNRFRTLYKNFRSNWDNEN